MIYKPRVAWEHWDLKFAAGLIVGSWAALGLIVMLVMLSACAPAPVLPQGCGDDTLQAIPRNATPAERQRIEWQNNDHACRCLMPTCPDYGLPS